MKIKTVCTGIDNVQAFDKMVNAALEEGWVLTKREMHSARIESECSALYAELIMPDAPVEPEKPADLMEAMRMIHAECAKYRRCADCPLTNVCDGGSPDNWRIGYAEEEENE